MAPNVTSVPTGVLYENETLEGSESLQSSETTKSKAEYRRRLVWINIVIFTFLHVAAVYGFCLALTSAKLYTTILGELIHKEKDNPNI